MFGQFACAKSSPPPYLLLSLLPQTTQALQPIFEFECHLREKVILILGGLGRAGSKPLKIHLLQ